MDNICFLVNIKTRICQSGVPLSTEKTFTNVNSSTNIILDNGYTLNIKQATNDTVDLIFTNTVLGFNFSFNVSNNTSTLYDLPLDSGTYKILIFVAMRCCNGC